MEREDLRLIPLATLGLIVGIAEVVVFPALETAAEHIGNFILKVVSNDNR
jgi:hypothetical protein